jgi:hypothetical protein
MPTIRDEETGQDPDQPGSVFGGTLQIESDSES